MCTATVDGCYLIVYQILMNIIRLYWKLSHLNVSVSNSNESSARQKIVVKIEIFSFFSLVRILNKYSVGGLRTCRNSSRPEKSLVCGAEPFINWHSILTDIWQQTVHSKLLWVQKTEVLKTEDGWNQQVLGLIMDPLGFRTWIWNLDLWFCPLHHIYLFHLTSM